MKKTAVYLLVLCMIFVMAGCKAESSENEDTAATSDNSEIDESIDYASIVELSINPAFRFYLDGNQNVIKVESLNEDAEAVCENLDLSEKSFDEALSEVLVESVNQGYLTDEKTVNVEVVSNESDIYAPDIIHNTAGIINDILTANNLKSESSVVMSDEIILEQSDTWSKEDLEIYSDIDETITEEITEDESEVNEPSPEGSNVCDSCGGTGNIQCDLCGGSGTVIEYEEHEVEVRNDYVCPYCGGAGILDDGKHGGQTAVCGNCGGDGATGPMSGDFRELAYDIEVVTEEVEKTCSRCGGSGVMICTQCNGTGTVE